MPFTGAIKEAIALAGPDVPTAVVSPVTPPADEVKRELVGILVRAGVLNG